MTRSFCKMAVRSASQATLYLSSAASASAVASTSRSWLWRRTSSRFANASSRHASALAFASAFRSMAMSAYLSLVPGGFVLASCALAASRRSWKCCSSAAAPVLCNISTTLVNISSSTLSRSLSPTASAFSAFGDRHGAVWSSGRRPASLLLASPFRSCDRMRFSACIRASSFLSSATNDTALAAAWAASTLVVLR